MFGRAVLAHRQRLGLTQEELAGRTGLGVRTIRRLESGAARAPRPASVRLLADAFGLSGDERGHFQELAFGEPSGVIRPEQLPADVAAFTGRGEELARLDAVLAAGSGSTAVVISALAGTAGVGKTALAVHWAHRVRARFPDGQLYVNLRGYDPGQPVPAAGALADRCARLPLALRLAAELAVSRPDVPLAALVGELTGHRRRLDLLDAGGDHRSAVETVFSWSLRSLPPLAVHVFRRAGLHPGPDFDAYDVAALADLDHDAARDALAGLARAHLVHPTGPGRFGMHDLLRAYAAAGADDATRREALTRLTDHLLTTAAAAMDSLYPTEAHRRPKVSPAYTPAPDLTDPAAARAWLDTERPAPVTARDRPARCSASPPRTCRRPGSGRRSGTTSGHTTCSGPRTTRAVPPGPSAGSATSRSGSAGPGRPRTTSGTGSPCSGSSATASARPGHSTGSATPTGTSNGGGAPPTTTGWRWSCSGRPATSTGRPGRSTASATRPGPRATRGRRSGTTARRSTWRPVTRPVTRPAIRPATSRPARTSAWATPPARWATAGRPAATSRSRCGC